ncbi:MAG: TIM-barrel domain-containing protein [Solirubrobacterales bacterium]
MSLRRFALFLLAAALIAPTSALAQSESEEIESGSASATVTADPWSIEFEQRGGQPLREQGGLGVVTPSGARRAIRARSLGRDGEAIVAEVEIEGGETIAVRLEPAGEGAFALVLAAPTSTAMTSAEFVAEPSERFYGFGERSDFVERRGHEAENYVSDGPVRVEDREYTRPFVPPWAARDRDDSTYFPLPWLLSSRGWGVLIDEDATSRLRPAIEREDRWEAQVDGARLRLRIFSGPTPAKALARFTAAVGRQPEPEAPWTFGPWFQTGQPNVIPPAEEQGIIDIQRAAGVPVSVGETQMHHLPCGAHESRLDAERERNAYFHAAGLARLVYFNPSLCLSYSEVYDRAAAAGVLQSSPGGAVFNYPAFVGGSGPLGFTEEPLAQFDWTNPATEGFYAELVDEAVGLGADGWMEDFGEGSPTTGVVQHDGSSGDAAHNRYPTDYHCAVKRIADRFDRPLVRHQRSGWTGSAACAEVVWGGDPTTVWGFDGISSVVTQALSIGLSGVARWGTDIGGYVSYGAGQEAKPGTTEDETLTDELLTRWMEVGALMPVMRTKRSGIAVPSYPRPQVYDEKHIEDWRRLTELHHQLNPYLRAADETYRRSGLPIVRHMVLSHPRSGRAQDADDQYLFGADLLAAPVVEPEVRGRSAWLPKGRWVEWWDSTRMAKNGAYELDRLRTVGGGRTRILDAPLGEPPLLLRAGAVLPLLDPDVETLSPYADEGGLVGVEDRARELRLLAVPRGRSRSVLPDGGKARSVERGGGWTLRLRSAKRMSYEVEASFGALKRDEFRPRRVLVNGRQLGASDWSYESGKELLRLAVRGRKLKVDVSR